MMSFPVQNLIVQRRTAKHKAGPLDAPVALYNPDGTPFKAGGDAPTTIPQGALTAGDGISLTRDQDSGVLTASIKAKGVTAAMIADGVIPAAYTLPAASTAARGGVKQSPPVAQVTLADPAEAAGESPTKAEFKALLDYAKALKTTLNQLIAGLSEAGVIAPKA
ncbi:hypothetical protein [Bifidobacterium jacchi]|uniref:Head fiber protein n=1 Tax=Bifidobacterium jacchi TaxID=2490545 RepID=A0A5N5REC2_9BIFI|nr:hypothetical protein [Bifidobacterium jacchi]KAB5604151.1 hypothetical protein EHS19_10080 [Bifidobacterium jacchi]